ncbi:MAG: hypothetical protein AB1757_23640 [Acidobacteriota bacterium]
MRKGRAFPSALPPNACGYAANLERSPEPLANGLGGAKPPPHIKAAQPPEVL